MYPGGGYGVQVERHVSRHACDNSRWILIVLSLIACLSVSVLSAVCCLLLLLLLLPAAAAAAAGALYPPNAA